MSNRVRILFHYAPEGPVAHVGLKALAAMRTLLTAPKEEWINQQEWRKRGQPEFLDRHVATGKMGKSFMKYLVKTPPASTGVELPVGLPLIERAKFLWQRLPTKLKQECRLIITRENRGHRWSRSRTNPRTYGWKNTKPSFKVSQPYGNKVAYYHKWANDKASELLDQAFSVGHHAPSTGPALQVQTDPGMSEEPADAQGIGLNVPAGSYEINIEKEIEETSHKLFKHISNDEGPQSPQVQEKAFKAKKPNPYLKYKKAPLRPAVPVSNAPEKPRLRVGIWA